MIKHIAAAAGCSSRLDSRKYWGNQPEEERREWWKYYENTQKLNMIFAAAKKGGQSKPRGEREAKRETNKEKMSEREREIRIVKEILSRDISY